MKSLWRVGLPAVGLLAAAGLLGWWLLSPATGGMASVRDPEKSPRLAATAQLPVPEAANPAPPSSGTPAQEERRPATAENLALPHEEEAPPEPEQPPAMDPELQPRTTFAQDYTKASRLPDGYTLSSLVLTERGIELPPPTDPDSPHREGVLVSANEPADFPGNSFTPFWLDQLPNGTDVSVEIAFSPNGQEWGPWSPVPRSEESDIEPVLQDGSPNPYFGYSAGPMFTWASDQWSHFRFRVTLASETEASPTLAGLRIYYQDSTLGTGQTGRLDQLDLVLPPGGNDATSP